MEIALKGPGEVTVCLIDVKGKTLLQETIKSSGSSTIEARRNISLVIATVSGRVPVAPVLVRKSHVQKVMFDREEPSSFTLRRCREIGCIDEVVRAAERGHAPLLRADEPRVDSIDSIQG